MRKKIIIGNWKMNGSVSSLKDFMNEVLPNLSENVEAGIAVPYPILGLLKDLSKGRNFKVSAQNMHFEKSGAFTGEVSSDMLIDLGVDTVIIGHSERRQYYNESDETVNLKLLKALEKNLLAIVCVGENLDERNNSKEKKVCERQILKAFEGVKLEDVHKVVVAYEPIWAIGTGKTASKEDAEEIASHIRNVLAGKYGKEAEKVRIQYGGSVKPSNVKELMEMPNIDGALVGGASLKAEDYIALINFDK